MIARIWRGAVAQADRDAYAEYMEATGVAGYTSIIVSIWLVGGLVMSSLGIIGLYLSKIMSETKERPFTVIRAEHGKGLQGPEPGPPM